MKNSYSLCITRFFVCLLALIVVDQASAQDRSRERPEDRAREVKEREEQRQQLERQQRRERQQLRNDIRNENRKKNFDMESYLRTQDKNKDGVIGAQEITNSRTISFLNRSGIPVGKRDYKVDELITKYRSRKLSETEQKRKEFARQSRNQLPSFGVKSEQEGVLSFGVDQDTSGSTLYNFSESISGLRSSDFSADHIEKAEELLSNFDRDKNQFLDGDEIARITWGSASPQNSDINHDGRLSKLELAQRFETIQSQRNKQLESSGRDSSRDRDSDRAQNGRNTIDRRSRSSKSSKSNKRVDKRQSPTRQSGLQTRSGRDRNRESQRTSTTTATRPTRKITASKSYENYIDRSFKKFDANSDGKLDQGELAETKLLKKANDVNGDGFISKREALDFVSNAGRKKTSPSSPTPKRVETPKTSPAQTARRASPSKNGERSNRPQSKTRFSSLSQLDKNGDGQIQMHEYTDAWTSEKLKTFRAKDKNSNGILSASEWTTRD